MDAQPMGFPRVSLAMYRSCHSCCFFACTDLRIVVIDLPCHSCHLITPGIGLVFRSPVLRCWLQNPVVNSTDVGSFLPYVEHDADAWSDRTPKFLSPNQHGFHDQLRWWIGRCPELSASAWLSMFGDGYLAC